MPDPPSGPPSTSRRGLRANEPGSPLSQPRGPCAPRRPALALGPPPRRPAPAPPPRSPAAQRPGPALQPGRRANLPPPRRARRPEDQLVRAVMWRWVLRGHRPLLALPAEATGRAVGCQQLSITPFPARGGFPGPAPDPAGRRRQGSQTCSRELPPPHGPHCLGWSLLGFGTHQETGTLGCFAEGDALDIPRSFRLPSIRVKERTDVLGLPVPPLTTYVEKKLLCNSLTR